MSYAKLFRENRGVRSTQFTDLICFIIICFMVSACSTTSVKFTRPELQIIPPESFHKFIVPGERVKIKTNEFEVQMRMEGYVGNDYLVGIDESTDKEVKIAITEINELQLLRQKEKINRPAGEDSFSWGNAAETIIYLPLVPVAVAMIPVLNVLGLDEVENSKVREKALLVYGGMTKEQLRSSIGEPEQKYSCNIAEVEVEVWSYTDKQVLRGGKYLFIYPKDNKVYYTSFRLVNKERCALITD